MGVAASPLPVGETCRSLRSARVALSRALSGGRARHPCEFGFANWPSSDAIDHDRLGQRAGLRIHDGHAPPFRGKMAVAKGEQCDEDRAEVTPTLRRPVFIPRRVKAVAMALQQSGSDQRIEPSRQHVWRNAEAFLE